MCTKTKTSFGCGHKYKNQQSCGDPSCTEVDKFHFQKDTDCQACRSGGETVTRGRDGMGRYGQQHHHRSERTTTPPPNSSSSIRQNRPGRIDVSGGAGPWSPDNTQTKSWHSPIRKNADKAWLNEHDARLSDLQDLFDKHSISSRSSRNASPNTSNERLVLRGEEYFPPKLRYAKTMPLPYEMQTIEYDSDIHSHRRSHRGRQRSDDSMPEYVEGPSIRTRRTEYAASSSDRDYYGRKQYRTHGARTEPYTYARSHLYESPVSGSPIEEGRYFDAYDVNQQPQYGYVRGFR